jgi:leucyl aminopeptidase
MTTVSMTTADPATAKADVVVIATMPSTPATKPSTHDGPGTNEASGAAALPILAAGAKTIDAAFGKKLASVLAGLGGTGRAGEIVKVPALGTLGAPLLIAVGLGPDGPTPVRLRAAVASATRAAKGTKKVVLALPSSDVASVAAQAEGAISGGYDFTAFRTTSLAGRKPAARAVQVTADGRALPIATARAAVKRGLVVGQALTFARDLINTPPRDLPPAGLAEQARKAAESVGVKVEILDEKALQRKGFGGHVGVGQGSPRPPRLVALRWAPPRATAHIALVGKGITFDSGGLSLKPPTSMETMKCDMSGAAAVAAAVVAAASLKSPVAVTGWLCCAENMPSGTAIRPSDVLTMYGGTRVEVLNTDAEGRLVLADGLARAAEDRPDAIIDIATLTGAAIVALGPKIAALMANDDAFRDRVAQAAASAGEELWPMPLPAEMRDRLDSSVADLANVPPSGGRDGGMLTAGLFLKHFVPDETPWAHLDIAGPAWNGGEASGDTAKGGVGFGVRTLLALIESYAS